MLTDLDSGFADYLHVAAENGPSGNPGTESIRVQVLSRQKLAGLGLGKSCLGDSILIHVYFLQNTSNPFSSSFPYVTQKPHVTISFLLSQEGTLSFPPSSAMEEEKII